MITDEHLKDIERVFDARVLDEIIDQYASNGTRPSQKVCEALAHVYGKTAGDIGNLLEAGRSAEDDRLLRRRAV